MKNTKEYMCQALFTAAFVLPLAAGAVTVASLEEDAPASPMGAYMAGAPMEGGRMARGPQLPGPMHGRPMHGGPMRGGPGGEQGPGGPCMPGEPPFLRGLELSEAQQDKIFTILHGQAPYLREQHRAHEKAMRSLHEMGLSDKFDDGAAQKLSQAAAQAEANIMLARVRTDQKLLAVLTPAQRQQIEARKEVRP